MKPVSATIAVQGTVMATDVATEGVATIGVACNTVTSAVVTTVDSVRAGGADDVGVGAEGVVAVAMFDAVDVEAVVVLERGASTCESLGTTPATTVASSADVVFANGKNSHIAS